jgi:hypothetical protein
MENNRENRLVKYLGILNKVFAYDPQFKEAGALKKTFQILYRIFWWVCIAPLYMLTTGVILFFELFYSASKTTYKIFQFHTGKSEENPYISGEFILVLVAIFMLVGCFITLFCPECNQGTTL